jgi:uncharacterized protein (DUF1800 family)
MSVSAALAAQAAPVDIGPRVAAYLLSRAAYGPRPGEVAQVLRQGLDRYIDEQLEPGPDPELDTRLRALGTLGWSMGEALSRFNTDGFARFNDEFLAAKLLRAVYARNQLQEVLTDFWFNHFNVFLNDGFGRVFTPFYEKEAIRPHVLGRFRDMLGATAAHPAMLYYLDNYLSTAPRTDPRTGREVGGLNENYGREVMELHTVGVDSGYEHIDVVFSSMCFTGWTIDFRTGSFVYRDQNHDKRVKSVFGLNLPAGGGKDDGDRLLDYLAAHPATARFVARRLLQRFVADDPPPALVERVGQVFERTDGDLRAVMKAILGSPEFWAQAFGAGKPRKPLEYVVAALRAVDAQVINTRGPLAALNGMGEPLYLCLPPTGYSNRGADWINPSTHLTRMNFGLDLAAGAVAGVAVDARAVVRRAGGDPDDPGSAARALAKDLFGNGLSRATVDAAARLARTGTPVVSARVLGLVLAGPEMQVR